MGRKVAWITVELILSILIALVILTAWEGFWVGSIVDGFSAASHHLFLFMDVGLLVFLLWLVVRAARGGRAYAAVGAAVAVLVNLLVVVIVGFVQAGAPPLDFVRFATAAGIAFLFAVLIATPIAHGLTRERE